MKRILVLVFFIFAANYQLQAQDFKQNQRIWMAYSGQFKVSTHWGFLAEVQYKMDNQLEQNQQNAYKIGGVYFLSPSMTITTGYALLKTFSPSLNNFANENRLWEQFFYNKKWHENKEVMIHRFRLEQRFVGKLALIDDNVQTVATNYQNRFRYLNRNLLHLANFKSGKTELYAVVQDEVFLIFGHNDVNTKLVDQNRFLIGLGLNYSAATRFEMGYLNQFSTSSASNDVMSHTISFSLIENLSL